MPLRIAVVVQRYGAEVAGGAELHARYVAELLAGQHRVTVLTTTARDYLSWRPHYPAGSATVDGVEVIRFPVEGERDPARFAAAAARAFASGHTIDDERRYLAEQGPRAPGIARHLREDPRRYDAVVAFSYRYLPTQEAALSDPRRTVLVPTAEADPAVGLETSKALFRSVGAIAYNSPEERDLILAAAANHTVSAEVVGVFSRIPEKPDPERFRVRHRIAGPYLLYVGRIDRNKGCPDLFDGFAAWSAESGRPHLLVLVGEAFLDIPPHPRIRHLGFVDDADKFDALAGADVLLVPSRYESLSMVTLEAMALGVPPLVNGRCAVLRGQVLRSDAGLYYEGYGEFFEALSLLVGEPRLRDVLGARGRVFYRREYAPEVVLAKYERLLARVAGSAS